MCPPEKLVQDCCDRHAHYIRDSDIDKMLICVIDTDSDGVPSCY